MIFYILVIITIVLFLGFYIIGTAVDNTTIEVMSVLGTLLGFGLIVNNLVYEQ